MNGPRMNANERAHSRLPTMDEAEVGRYWDGNVYAWTTLARQGWDVYRDAVNTPAFLELLPEIRGLTGLDIGCGEGNNTRLITQRGARMFAVDIAPGFVRAAAECAAEAPIHYTVGGGQALPFASQSFDFVTAIMSLMDMPQPGLALAEAHRVLRPGGFLQFSILHPCFNTPHRKLVRDAFGRACALEVAQYFERTERVDEFLFGAAPAEVKKGLAPFRIPYIHRTLSDWLNLVIGAGFQIERVAEPYADEATAARVPKVADTRIAAYFLHLLCRKAGTG